MLSPMLKRKKLILISAAAQGFIGAIAVQACEISPKEIGSTGILVSNDRVLVEVDSNQAGSNKYAQYRESTVVASRGKSYAVTYLREEMKAAGQDYPLKLNSVVVVALSDGSSFQLTELKDQNQPQAVAKDEPVTRSVDFELGKSYKVSGCTISEKR